MTLAAPFTVLVFVHPERHIDTHMCVIYMAFIYLARRAGSLILYYTVCIRKVSGGNGYRFVRWYKNKTSICGGRDSFQKFFRVGGSSHDNKRMSDPSRSCGPFALFKEDGRREGGNKRRRKRNGFRWKTVQMPIGSDANPFHLIRRFPLLFYRMA